MLSVSPAPSAHLAALRIRQQVAGLPWIAQFHDPWATNPYSQLPRALQTVAAALERRVIEGSDAAAFATEEAVGLYAARYGTQRRLFTLHNGFDPLDIPGFDARERSDARTTFIYAGALYGHRDPFPFLTALSRLVRGGQVDATSVRVRFMGDCETAVGRSVRDGANDLGLARVVEVTPPVSYPEALRAQVQSDVLLLFAEDQPAQIPAKLFDYLPLRRPVLAFTSGASARLVQSTGIGLVVQSDDDGAIEAAILGFMRPSGKHFSLPGDGIERYGADFLAGHLATELNAVVERGQERRGSPRPLTS
jgi:hypothetical protein